MSNIRVAINGFGRIGRLTFRALLERAEVEIVAINDLTDTHTLAHLLKYDSVQGTFAGEVSNNDDTIIVNGKSIKALKEADPAKLPWADMKIDVVIESTGRFVKKEEMMKHVEAGAKRVILSAPPKGDVPIYVMGVNDNELSANDIVLSNASCTTNCLAPMVKVIDDLCGIQSGFLSTIHSYTSDQRLIDAPHSDLRRARSAAINIIPTSTGAAEAVGKVLKHLNGKLTGGSFRVPTPTGSVTDFVCLVNKSVTAEEINNAFKAAAEGPMKGILKYTTLPLVSADIVGDVHSCILDSDLTMVNGNLVKVVGWYDNEAGYSNRMADITIKVGNLIA
ncbi:MAG: type I glyceraldehyde-3-phosphate dehydrogenase [Bacteroidota bacterium]|nr:type I glyceraldehyde-3-phosphate dehydrogenase [Bacteroidota bacterium]